MREEDMVEEKKEEEGKRGEERGFEI